MAFTPRIPRKADLRRIDSYLGDITGKLDRLSSVNANWNHDVAGVTKRYSELNRQMAKIVAQARAAGRTTPAQARQLRQLASDLSELPSRLRVITSYLGKKLVVALDRVGKGIISLGLGTFEEGLEGVHKGIYKVWELQERWTKALGGLNMQIGSLSPNMQGFRKEAVRWEGTIRGLTDNFGEGLQMAQDFSEGFARILPADQEARWGKLGLGIARGLGLGGQLAGQFLHSMVQLDQSVDETNDTFGEIISSAKAAGVSVNGFSREIAESRNFMVSFGKEGQKAFIQSAAFARKLGVSLKSLEAFTKSTDTFDQTAESVGKLNTVFGTTIDSLDLMLKQDPGKRLEIVRQQLLGQGKNFENLSRQERELIAETLHLSEEEVAGVLKSGQSLEEFQAKANAEKEKQVKTEKLIKQAMAATAQTMFAFGAAWDRVTKSITQLIRPFTDVLGLTRSGGKDVKSFGQVMSAVFGRLNKFILDVAHNKDWQAFMKRLASDAVDLYHRVSKFLSGKNLTTWLESGVKAAKDFYAILKGAFGYLRDAAVAVSPVLKFVLEHIQGILAAWAGMRIAIGGFKLADTLSQAFGGPSLAALGAKAGGSLGAAVVGALGAALAGAGIAVAFHKFVTEPLMDSIYGTQEDAEKALRITQERMEKAAGKGTAEKLDPEKKREKELREEEEIQPDYKPDFLLTKEQKASRDQERADRVKKEQEDDFLEEQQWKSKRGILAAITGPSLEEHRAEIRKKREEEHRRKMMGRSAESPEKVEDRPSVSQAEQAPKNREERVSAEPTPKQRKERRAELDETTGAPVIDRRIEREAQKQERREISKRESETDITTGMPIDRRPEKAQAPVVNVRVPDKSTQVAKAMEKSVREAVSSNQERKVPEAPVAAPKKDEPQTPQVPSTKAERAKKAEALAKSREEIAKKEIELNKERIETGKKAESDLMKHLQARLRSEDTNDKKLFQLRLMDFLREKSLDTGYRGDFKKDFEDALALGGESLLDSAAGVRKLVGGLVDKMERSTEDLPHLAQGGIARRPTKAVVGEAGPEAIVPLRVMQQKTQAPPARVTKEEIREIIREIDSERPSSRKSDRDIKIVAGDVYLDGKKVGSHLARALLESE